MNVKNNYNKCITNVACSIRKYFELEYHHNTIDYIDSILEEKNPKNVVVILFDGMGSYILDRAISYDSFFIKNRKDEITSVFPATTTAATTSMMTGLNPIEHGFLGWNTYLEPIDDTIALFLGVSKDTLTENPRYKEVKEKYLNKKKIVDEINEAGKYSAISLFPFGDNPYHGLDDMLIKIKEECEKDGRKYIYAYDDEPDHTMHDLGPDSKEVRELIKIRNDKVKLLAENLEDTLVIVLADHGHIKVDNLFLRDYPDICDMLERTTSIEQRAVSFKIKDGEHEKFEARFKEVFGEYFKLYTKQDVIDSQLFGDGEANEIFDAAIGDYIAIAEDSNKTIVYDNDDVLFSHHAGYTNDEIYIPIILIDKTK